MKQKLNANSKAKKSRPKTKLGIPDLEISKAAVLRSLGLPDSRRGYQHAIDEFVAWRRNHSLRHTELASALLLHGLHRTLTYLPRPEK